MSSYCTALKNAPENPKGSYNRTDADRLYRCKITGGDCVGKSIDDSGEGPYPMFHTIYKAVLNTCAVISCPARNLSPEMQESLKAQIETSQRQSRFSRLEKELASLKEKEK